MSITFSNNQEPNNCEEGLGGFVGPYMFMFDASPSENRSSDSSSPSLSRALSAFHIEIMEPERWVDYLAELPKFFAFEPALANEEWIMLLLGGVGNRAIHGQDEIAIRLCEAAEVTWAHLGYAQSKVGLILADWWIRFDQVKRAEGIYQRLLVNKNDQTSAAALAPHFGWLLMAERKPEAALHVLETAWSSLEKEPEERRENLRCMSAIILTLASLETGDLSQAKESLKHVHLDKTFALVARNLAEFINAPNSRVDSGLRARGYYFVAEAFFNLEWWQQAILCYKRSIEANLQSVQAHLHLGDAYFAQGMTLKAVAEYQNAIEIKHDDAPSHRYLGHAQLRLGKLEEAIQSTERALEIDPGYFQAASQLKNLREMKKSGGLSANSWEWPT